MPDPKVESAVQHATSMLDAGGGNSVKAARDALDYLKTIDGLTPAQRKEAIVATATHAASHGCDEALSSPTTLLRSNTQYTAFIKNVISDYSAEYREAVKNSAQEVSNQMVRQMPQVGIVTADHPTPVLNTDNMPRAGFRPTLGSTMDEQDVAAWDQFYEQGGKLLVQAQTDNLSKLDPVALETLQACETTARDKFQHLEPEELETVVNSMNVNNVMLRVSSPVVATQLTIDTDLPEDQQKLQRTCNVRMAQVAQTYLNGAEGTQAAIITRQMRADAAFTQATDNQLKAACQGQLQSTVSISALEKSASEVQVAEAPGKMSVRDILRGAADRVSNAASNLKATITDKVDQLKLERLEKQLEKRENHLARLERDFQAMGDVGTRQDRDTRLAELQSQYDPVNGDPTTQREIADEIDEIKAANKLEDRITKNQAKVDKLETKVQAQEDKIKLRADRKQNAQQQDQSAPALSV